MNDESQQQFDNDDLKKGLSYLIVDHIKLVARLVYSYSEPLGSLV